VEENTGQLALESLWALNLSGGFDDETAIKTMNHSDPFVRLWTVRLLGDAREVSASVAQKLVELAAGEANVEVRAQLACSAKRLPVATWPINASRFCCGGRSNQNASRTATP